MNLISTTGAPAPELFQTARTHLTHTAATLYDVLRRAAEVVRDHRGYVHTTTHITLHIPLEIVAEALGVHRVTVWRAARQLRDAGLIDARPHKTTLEGRVVNDGTLWLVKLGEGGAPARLTFEEMKHSGWRDLEGDRRRGRTAYKTIKERREKRAQQSKTLQDQDIDLELLLEWSLPLSTQKAFVNMTVADGVRCDLEQVLDVQFAEKENRNAAVDGAARAIGAALGDAGGTMFWRWLLWQMVRLEASGVAAPWYMLYEQVRRAQADKHEGFAKKPGALLASRLKNSPWWDAVMRAPPVRVGMRPNGMIEA